MTSDSPRRVNSAADPHSAADARPAADAHSAADPHSAADARPAADPHPAGVPRDAARGRLLAERERLSSLQDALRNDLSAESENDSLSELSDADQHPADVGTETFNRERDMSTLESVDGELADVEAALQRLEDGTYGNCEACGRPISPARLDALPATRFCVEDAELASAEAAPGVAPLGPSGGGPSGGKPLEEPGRAI